MHLQALASVCFASCFWGLQMGVLVREMLQTIGGKEWWVELFFSLLWLRHVLVMKHAFGNIMHLLLCMLYSS